jgi:hypothetical protein
MQLFAGHLPISPNAVLPQQATDAQFNAIFQPAPKWFKTQQTIDSLNGVIGSLDAQVAEGEMTSLTSEEAVISLDGVQANTPFMQDPLADYYRTNRPPPPPRPIEDPEPEQRVTRRRVRGKGKSWQTTITVTEWTDGQGHRTFSADTSPIVRVSQQQQAAIEEPAQQRVAIRQPFLDRLRTRQIRWQDKPGAAIRSPLGKKPRMMLISVKRQRKAKMKKHKLKKLRKRTRNLRRKLGKL